MSHCAPWASPSDVDIARASAVDSTFCSRSARVPHFEGLRLTRSSETAFTGAWGGRSAMSRRPRQKPIVSSTGAGGLVPVGRPVDASRGVARPRPSEVPRGAAVAPGLPAAPVWAAPAGCAVAAVAAGCAVSAAGVALAGSAGTGAAALAGAGTTGCAGTGAA